MTTETKTRRKASADTPRRSVADIAAAVAEEQDRQRRDAARADVEAWRALVYSVADGHEPSGEQLRSIGELSARLKAPSDSLTTGVTAVERDRDFERQLAEASARLRDLKAREPELRAALEDARQKLRALEAEAADFHRVATTVPDIQRSKTENRVRCPLLFADPDTVVTLLLKADAALGLATLNPLRQQRGNVT